MAVAHKSEISVGLIYIPVDLYMITRDISIAYLDSNGTELRNKKDLRLLPKVPELSNIHKAAKQKCILDGELI